MQGAGGGGFWSGKLQNIHSTYYASPITSLDRFLSGQNNNHSSQDNVVYNDMVVSSNGLCSFWSSNDHAMGGGSNGAGGYGYVPLLPPSESDQETSSFLDGVLLDRETIQWETDQASNKEMVISKTSKSGGKRTKRGSRAALIKGQWTDEEDRKLIKLVKQYGTRKWAKIAESLVGRAGKQCRERWHNHLRPDIKKHRWSEEEERILVEVHEKVGNRWAEIARLIPGRSENTIKNHWNATIRKHNSISRRKQKHQSSQKLPQPSILQEYIKSKLNLGNINTNNNNIDTTLCHDIGPSVSTASSEEDTSLASICPTYDDELVFMLNIFANNQNSNTINDVLSVIPTTTDHEVEADLSPNVGVISQRKDEVMNYNQEVSGTQVCSDRYLAYLFNETTTAGSLSSSEVAYCSSTVTDNVNKEMDLMEMVSSSQTSNYSCCSNSFSFS